MTRILALAVLLCPSFASAWSEGGHHLIGLIAYHLLDADEKKAFQAMLAEHPRYGDDFKVPGDVDNGDRWRAGRTGYWPDVARRQPKYNRADWHWQDDVSLVVGDRRQISLPKTVLRVPPSGVAISRRLAPRIGIANRA